MELNDSRDTAYTWIQAFSTARSESVFDYPMIGESEAPKTPTCAPTCMTYSHSRVARLAGSTAVRQGFNMLRAPSTCGGSPLNASMKGGSVVVCLRGRYLRTASLGATLLHTASIEGGVGKAFEAFGTLKIACTNCLPGQDRLNKLPS